MAYHMTRDEFKESIDEIIYWVENKEENLCPDFDPKNSIWYERMAW